MKRKKRSISDKEPRDVIGKWLYKNYEGTAEGYQLGDYGVDARAIVTALSNNGFKVVRRRASRASRKESR